MFGRIPFWAGMWDHELRARLIPEVQIVLAAASANLQNTSSASIASILRSGVDLSLVLRISKFEKTYPLLHEHLSRITAEEVYIPGFDEFLAQLCVLKQRSKCRMKNLERLMEYISICADKQDVDYMYIRGPRFGRRYYPCPDLRPAADLDLLVKEKDLDRFLLALKDFGFHLQRNAQYANATREYVGQIELYEHSRTAILDLNWKLSGNGHMGPLSLDMAEVWRRARKKSHREYELDPSDDLVQLIQHIGHGHDFQMGTIRCCTDVECLLSACKSEIDWHYITYQCTRARCENALAFFQHFYETIFGGKPAFVSSLKGGRIKRPTRYEAVKFNETVTLQHIESYGRTSVYHSTIRRQTIVLLSRLWMSDGLVGWLYIIQGMCLPSRYQAILFGNEKFVPSILRRRIQLYKALALIMPWLVYGTTVKLWFQIVRRFRMSR